MSTFCPPPKLLTEMLLSVLLPVVRVPTWVGCRVPGGGGARWVYFGSQSVALAVVSWLATVRGDDGLLVSRDAGGREWEELEEARIAGGLIASWA